MGFFSSLFGFGSSRDIPQVNLPDPPRLRIESQEFLGDINRLIDTFETRARGEDQFDFTRFLFEPQLARLNQNFGLGAPGALTQGDFTPDLFARGGILPRTLAQANATGTLDAGTANLIRAQLEAERARQESELFGEAKILQRQDIDNALATLGQSLFPSRFAVTNIPNQVDFFNAQNAFNQQVSEQLANAGIQSAANATAGQNLGSLVGNIFQGAISPLQNIGNFNNFGGGGGGPFQPVVPGQRFGVFGSPDVFGQPNILPTAVKDFLNRPVGGSLITQATPGVGSLLQGGQFNPLAGAGSTFGGDRGRQIGSTVGSLAGTPFGPLGSVAGSVLGNIVGGLF